MTQRLDILDTAESMRGAFWAAVGLHMCLIFGGILYGYIGRNAISFGDPNAGGAAVGIEAVKSIPIPHQGPANPVANDTKSTVPQTPAPPVERAKVEKPPPPDAVPLKLKEQKKKPAPVASAPQRFRPYQELEKNQLTTKSAPQVSNPVFTAQTGAGRIGAGANTTLGQRWGGYAAQIQTLVGQHWNTGDVDARYQTAPMVIATFEIHRDGSISNVQLLQTSGIGSLDFSVRRAILDASPFPPLPADFPRDSAKVEFNFELKR